MPSLRTTGGGGGVYTAEDQLNDLVYGGSDVAPPVEPGMYEEPYVAPGQYADQAPAAAPYVDYTVNAGQESGGSGAYGTPVPATAPAAAPATAPADTLGYGGGGGGGGGFAAAPATAPAAAGPPPQPAYSPESSAYQPVSRPATAPASDMSMGYQPGKPSEGWAGDPAAQQYAGRNAPRSDFSGREPGRTYSPILDERIANDRRVAGFQAAIPPPSSPGTTPAGLGGVLGTLVDGVVNTDPTRNREAVADLTPQGVKDFLGLFAGGVPSTNPYVNEGIASRTMADEEAMLRGAREHMPAGLNDLIGAAAMSQVQPLIRAGQTVRDVARPVVDLINQTPPELPLYAAASVAAPAINAAQTLGAGKDADAVPPEFPLYAAASPLAPILNAARTVGDVGRRLYEVADTHLPDFPVGADDLTGVVLDPYEEGQRNTSQDIGRQADEAGREAIDAYNAYRVREPGEGWRTPWAGLRAPTGDAVLDTAKAIAATPLPGPDPGPPPWWMPNSIARQAGLETGRAGQAAVESFRTSNDTGQAVQAAADVYRYTGEAIPPELLAVGGMVPLPAAVEQERRRLLGEELARRAGAIPVPHVTLPPLLDQRGRPLPRSQAEQLRVYGRDDAGTTPYQGAAPSAAPLPPPPTTDRIAPNRHARLPAPPATSPPPRDLAAEVGGIGPLPSRDIAAERGGIQRGGERLVDRPLPTVQGGERILPTVPATAPPSWQDRARGAGQVAIERARQEAAGIDPRLLIDPLAFGQFAAEAVADRLPPGTLPTVNLPAVNPPGVTLPTSGDVASVANAAVGGVRRGVEAVRGRADGLTDWTPPARGAGTPIDTGAMGRPTLALTPDGNVIPTERTSDAWGAGTGPSAVDLQEDGVTPFTIPPSRVIWLDPTTGAPHISKPAYVDQPAYNAARARGAEPWQLDEREVDILLNAGHVQLDPADPDSVYVDLVDQSIMAPAEWVATLKAAPAEAPIDATDTTAIYPVNGSAAPATVPATAPSTGGGTDWVDYGSGGDGGGWVDYGSSGRGRSYGGGGGGYPSTMPAGFMDGFMGGGGGEGSGDPWANPIFDRFFGRTGGDSRVGRTRQRRGMATMQGRARSGRIQRSRGMTAPVPTIPGGSPSAQEALAAALALRNR